LGENAGLREIDGEGLVRPRLAIFHNRIRDRMSQRECFHRWLTVAGILSEVLIQLRFRTGVTKVTGGLPGAFGMTNSVT
jgi:hypothetical protein